MGHGRRAEVLTERAELLELLTTQGIFRSTDEHPVVSGDGTRVAWMLDSMRVSLTARGARLAAHCLLEQLAQFDATQIATYGLTAVPLMQACIAESGGAYTGLIVRKEPKGYGSGKMIEGPLDPSKPIVILDDSIASGSSIFKCVAKLEEAGLRVEGGVVLVRFGYGGGWARMIARGLRMAKVFDVNEDLVPITDAERSVLRDNVSLRVPDVAWADERAPDGLHATAFARRVMEAYLAGAPVPRAPAHLDQSHDASGGAWVSVRSRANVQQRFARNGFWVLPGEAQPDAPAAITTAALRTAKQLTREQLDGGSIAVTFFGALERCTVGELDQERYGILVRGRERPEQWGGALPAMPSIFRDWAQFDHARTNNCKLHAFEPYELFRHTVTKAIEPGAPWQPDGVPRPPTPAWHAHAPRIAARARELVHEVVAGTRATGEPLAEIALDGLHAVYLSVFRDGVVLACVGNRIGASIEQTLRDLAQVAKRDGRFREGAETRSFVVVTSFIDRLVTIPNQTPAAIAPHIDPRRNALVVQQNARQALLLPFVALQHSLTQPQFVAELIDKAGITRPPYSWTRVEATSWFADGDTVGTMPWSLPAPAPLASVAAGIEQLLPRMLGYVRMHARDNLYRPLADVTRGELDRARQAHGAWTLAAAHRVLGGDGTHATDAIARFAAIDDLELHEVAMLALAMVEQPHAQLAALTARLARSIDAFGTIIEAELPKLPPGPDEPDAAKAREIERARRVQQLDYLLPQVVLALAVAPGADREAMRRGLRRAARRFEVLPAWAQVAWLPQAAAAAYRLAPDPATAQIAFAVADWALPYQQTSSGGFINAEQLDGPGCTTAVYLEGIAAALELAVAVGDRERAERYRTACTAALTFVDALVYQERDRGFLPAPERAYGGVRLSRTAGDVRTDFVQHAILALLRLQSLMGM